jgi:hypothetical protein
MLVDPEADEAVPDDPVPEDAAPDDRVPEDGAPVEPELPPGPVEPTPVCSDVIPGPGDDPPEMPCDDVPHPSANPPANSPAPTTFENAPMPMKCVHGR